jgi:cytochrome oxidase Cu insertion factor (SCO1/SenC/PrrC family)
MSRAPVLRLAFTVAALVALAAACSSKGDDRADDSTTTSVAATSSSTTESTETTTSVTTSATAPDNTTSIPAAQDAISVAVYWTRANGTPRPIDIPAYQDQPDGPYPYVLYGSVTNAGGKPLAQPKVTVDWYANGGSIHQATVSVLDAQGVALDRLDPGASGDLLVVVDAPVADQLIDAQPSFGSAQL